jgi:predicted MPP superfamily phosphohydrolase
LEDKAILQPLKIAMVSDLHIGAVNSEQYLEKTVGMINSIEPDIVLIPGDIFNDDYYLIQNPEKVVELFQQIKSKHGVYASLGNHDGGKNYADFASLLTRSGIKLLNDEAMIVDGKVALLGRVDASPVGGFPDFSRKSAEEMQAVIAELPKELPLIVMDHNPIHVGEYGGETDLIVAGHTHRGQLFPGSLFTKALFAVDYGYYRKDENSPQVVVSSGAGTWAMPMRVGSQTEVVEIRLQ